MGAVDVRSINLHDLIILIADVGCTWISDLFLAGNLA